MSLIKPATLFVCVALAGCAGKWGLADSAKDAAAAKEKPLVQAQKPESKPAAEPQAKKPAGADSALSTRKEESTAATKKDAKSGEPAAKPEEKVAGKPAAKPEEKTAAKPTAREEKSSWWSFGGKKKAAATETVAKKVEVVKITPAWLDDNEKRLKEAVAGSKFQVERRGDVLVVVAPADASFNPDRPSMLLPITLGPLSRIAKLVASDPQNAVLILGHADGSGKAEDGRKLSLERAQSVASIFRMSGLKSDRLMLRGIGADKPLASNDNAKGRAQNRRIEVMLTMRHTLSDLVAQNSR